MRSLQDGEAIFEFLTARRCRLVGVGVKVGGQFGNEAARSAKLRTTKDLHTDQGANVRMSSTIWHLVACCETPTLCRIPAYCSAATIATGRVTKHLCLLARHRSFTVPVVLRPAARSGWVARWSGLLAVAVQHAFAATLLEIPFAGERNVVGDAPARGPCRCALAAPRARTPSGTAWPLARRWGSRWGTELRHAGGIGRAKKRIALFRTHW